MPLIIDATERLINPVFDGIVTYIPSPIVTVKATEGILVTHTDMKLVSDGGAIIMTANPQIIAGRDRQRISFQGTSDINTIQFNDGNGVVLQRGISCILGLGDLIDFFYDLSRLAWVERFRRDNY